MEGTNIRILVGGTFKQDDTILRVIATKGEEVLLEQWKGNELIQYIVTNGLFVEHNELHWHGSGAYFPCMYPPPTCDTPYITFSKAIEYMHGPRMVYVVISNTDYGTSASVKPTLAEAKLLLQNLLDSNDDIQHAAKTYGIDHLTVDAYLNDGVCFELGVTDLYSIDAQEVDF